MGRPAPWLRDPLLVWAPPAVCALAAFAPCVVYSEWYVDELFAVLRNEDARGQGTWRQLLTNDFWGNPLRGGEGSWTHKSYRPLCVLSFAWQFRLLGGDLFRPQPLRAFNAALHAANSLLLAALLRSGLRLSARWCRLAACLFALHPVHAENVVYLVGRADMLATTGWLVASLVHLRFRGARQQDLAPHYASGAVLLAFGTLLAVCSGLSKESGLTLPVFLAGVELCTRRASPRLGVGLALAALAVFAALGACRLLITQGTETHFGFVDTPVQYHGDVWARSWTYLFQHAFYARLLVLPGRLSWDYSYDTLPVLKDGWRDVRALAVLCAYLGLVALAARALTGAGGRRTVLGLLAAIVPFVPASNLFFVVGVTVGERLLYPSTVGAAVVFASVGQALELGAPAGRGAGRGPGAGGRSWPWVCGAALVCFYAVGCSVRVWQWRSSEALYEADAAHWPRSVKTQHQLGTIYHAQGRYAEALEHYNASLAVLDDNALTDHVIAQVFIETGRYDDAIQRFQKIQAGHFVGFAPFNLYMFYIDYGFALVAGRHFEEAIPLLEHGLKRNTAVPHGINALGYAFVRVDKLQEAQDWFARGLEYDPDNAVIWNNLSVVWMMAGALEQAAAGLERALQLEPGNGAARHNAQLLQRAAAAAGAAPEGVPRLELFFTRSS